MLTSLRAFACAFALLMVSAAAAADRVVVVEKFTATWCGPCKPVGEYLGDLMDANPDSLTWVHIHSEDSLQTQWALTRRCFYGYCDPAYAFPTTVFDGKLRYVGGYGEATYVAAFNSELSKTTDVTLTLYGEPVSGTTYRVTIVAGLEAGGVAKSMNLHLVQVLDHYPDANPWSRNAFIQAAPLQQISLQPGQTVELTHDFTFNTTSWNKKNDIKIIGYLQEVKSVWPAQIYQGYTMAWPFEAPPSNTPGDIDGDGVVGQLDLNVLLSQWGCTGASCTADVDGDGFVGQLDLNILLSNYGN